MALHKGVSFDFAEMRDELVDDGSANRVRRQCNFLTWDASVKRQKVREGLVTQEYLDHAPLRHSWHDSSVDMARFRS